MTAYNCRVMTKDELRALVCSEQPAEREEAVRFLVALLTATDDDARCRGYEFFREGLSEALFHSCLNYGSLAGGFTDPLVDTVTRAIEFWAAGRKTQQASAGR
jgi:hypothetical protein